VDSFTGLLQVVLTGIGGVLIALTGFIGMIHKGNREARKREAEARQREDQAQVQITENRRRISVLEGRLMQAHGIIIRLRLVLVANGFMTDPDLTQAADGVLEAAERGEQL
jgi:hypothetical protein